MRAVTLVACAASLIFGLAVSSAANAAPMVTLLWTGTSGTGAGVGTDTIDAASGDTLTLTLFISLMPGDAISGYGISLEFDTDLDDELNIGATSESLPAGFTFNATPGVSSTTDSTGGSGGNVLTYEALSFGSVGGPALFAIGTATFTVNGSVNSDGIDVQSGLFNPGVDASPGGLATTFKGASVNVVPEPGTVSLLALGLVGLTLAGKRRS